MKSAHTSKLFFDQKSRGFQLDRGHLDDPERVNRLLTLAPRLRAGPYSGEQVQVSQLAWRICGSSIWAAWRRNRMGGASFIGPIDVT